MTRSAVQREYSALAAGYDTRWSGYVQATTDMAIARMPLTPAARVLDVGCGTGVLLDHALIAEPTLRCTGVDLTGAMLRRAHARLAGRTLLTQCSGEQLPFPDARFDVVVSTSALHYMSDSARVLHEMRRVLVSGGTIVVTDWCADFRTMRWLDRVLRVVDPAHVRTMRCAELAAAMKNAGFVQVVAESKKIDRFWGIMTVSGRSS